MLTRLAVLSFLRRIEEDPERAIALQGGGTLFEAAVADGLVTVQDVDQFASVIGQLVAQGLVQTDSRAAGLQPFPSGRIWDSFELQSRFGYHLTADGLHATGAVAADSTPTADNSSAPPNDFGDLSASSRPSVFISYAHEDKQVAHGISGLLEGAGCDVWIDEADLLAGDSVVRGIADAVGETDFLVALLSRSSVDSAWCQKEISLAVTEGLNSVRVKVIPVRLDNCDVPRMLGDVKYVQFNSRAPARGFGQLVRSIVGQHSRQFRAAPGPSAVMAQQEQLAIDLERIDDWERAEKQTVASEFAGRGVTSSSALTQARDAVSREASRQRREAQIHHGQGPVRFGDVTASPEVIRFRAHYVNDGGSSRVQLTNEGSIAIHNLNLTVPVVAQPSFHLMSEMVAKLPPGDTASFGAFRTMGAGASNFDLTVTGTTPDGRPVSATAFVSLT